MVVFHLGYLKTLYYLKETSKTFCCYSMMTKRTETHLTSIPSQLTNLFMLWMFFRASHFWKRFCQFKLSPSDTPGEWASNSQFFRWFERGLPFNLSGLCRIRTSISFNGTPTWDRTKDLRVISTLLYLLSYRSIWWAELDSNQRSLSTTDLQSVALPTTRYLPI